MTIIYDAPTRGRSPTKKALLVGISYPPGTEGNDQKLNPIPTSIQNVNMFKQFIQDHWGYTDIVVMTDEDGVEKRMQPTRANLMREIKALGRRVKPGDRRIFYFTGHSSQLPCKTGTEADDLDENLVSSDGFKIQDNALNDFLVKGLPEGAALTAIFDACHSGTLLDLPHYKCNGVYYPWINKGKRSSNSRCSVVEGEDEAMVCSESLSQPRSGMGSGEGNFPSSSIFGAMHCGKVLKALRTTRKRLKFWTDLSVLTFPTVMQNETHQSDEDPNKHSGGRCMSPEHESQCDGWCRKNMQSNGSLPQADVISISSSNDGQTSWDGRNSDGEIISMTSCLIKILTGFAPPLRVGVPTEQTSSEQRPRITYADLMTRLNHDVHSYTMHIHEAFRQRGLDCSGEGTEPDDEGEMDDFQDLQLGSSEPLDMDFKL